MDESKLLNWLFDFILPGGAGLIQDAQQEEANRLNRETIGDIEDLYYSLLDEGGTYWDQNWLATLAGMNALYNTTADTWNQGTEAILGTPFRTMQNFDWTSLVKPAVAPSSVQPQAAFTEGEQPGDIQVNQPFNLDWLPPEVRRDAEAWRWWQGPNSVAGKLRGYTEDQYQQDMYKQFAQYVPGADVPKPDAAGTGVVSGAPVTQTTQEGLMGPLTGKTYYGMTPEEVMQAEWKAFGVPTNDQGQPVDENLEGFKKDLPKALQGYKGRYEEGMKIIEDIGLGQSEEIERITGNIEQAGIQDLINRGVYGSTELPGVRRGAAREEGRLKNELAGRMAGIKAGYHSDLSGDFLAALERRVNQGTGLMTDFGTSILNASVQNWRDRLDFETGLTDRLANVKGNLVYQGPGYTDWPSLITDMWSNRSARRAMEAQADQGGNEGIFGPIGGAAGAAGGGLIGAAISPGAPFLGFAVNAMLGSGYGTAMGGLADYFID